MCFFCCKVFICLKVGPVQSKLDRCKSHGHWKAMRADTVKLTLKRRTLMNYQNTRFPGGFTLILDFNFYYLLFNRFLSWI